MIGDNKWLWPNEARPIADDRPLMNPNILISQSIRSFLAVCRETLKASIERQPDHWRSLEFAYNVVKAAASVMPKFPAAAIGRQNEHKMPC